MVTTRVFFEGNFHQKKKKQQQQQQLLLLLLQLQLPKLH